MLNAVDIQEIKNLMYTYAIYVDQREHVRLGEMFAKGTIKSNRGEVGGGLVGADAVRAAYDRNNKVAPDGTAGTKHLVTNINIAPRQDRESAVLATSYFTVCQATPALPLQAIVMGRYEDRFVLEDENWRFQEKIIFVDLMGDLSEHLNIQL
jgi:hypothetical protein